jgi:hypothetical protein
MAITLDGTLGITSPAETVQGALTTTGNTILGDATTDTLTVGVTGIVKDASGNVGIGTANPKKRLTVIDATSAATTPGTNPILWIGGGTANVSTLSEIGFTYGFTSAYGETNAPTTIGYQLTSGSGFTKGALTFCTRDVTTDTAPTERMRIDSSGNLLVGTTATINTAGVSVGKGGAANGGIVNLYKTASGATNGLLNYYQSTYVGGINFDNTSTSFPTSSDKRLKKDISDSASATQKIDSIRIVSHGWKHDESVVDFGIIAQDLYEIMPRAVSKGDDEDEIKTIWSVDYSKLVPLLIKAHQEQQALITALTTRITALEGAAA